MQISTPDRISGTVYVIAPDATQAADKVMDRLRDKDAVTPDYGVFDTQADAEQRLAQGGMYDTDRDRVYAISLDIRIATEK